LHSLAGRFFYGAFAAKVLLIRGRYLPAWAFRKVSPATVSAILKRAGFDPARQRCDLTWAQLSPLRALPDSVGADIEVIRRDRLGDLL
jgi:hypothetical protein